MYCDMCICILICMSMVHNIECGRFSTFIHARLFVCILSTQILLFEPVQVDEGKLCKDAISKNVNNLHTFCRLEPHVLCLDYLVPWAIQSRRKMELHMHRIPRCLVFGWLKSNVMDFDTTVATINSIYSHGLLAGNQLGLHLMMMSL